MRSLALSAIAISFALVFCFSAEAFGFPETAYPGRTEYGDGCWNSNCHGVGNDQGTGPHGNYAATSNICGICHTLHEAPTSNKLLPEETLTDTCFFCHDGTQATGKGVYGAIASQGLTVRAQHRVSTTNTIPGGDASTGGSATRAFSENGNLGCGDCHSPHGSNTVTAFAGERARNSPEDTFRNWWLRSTRLLKNRPSGATTVVAEYGSDWCAACHEGRVSGGMVTNHPVDLRSTNASPFVYDRVARVTSDTSSVTVVLSMGRLGSRQRHNRAFVMPYPRTAEQAGHAPICQQCHEDARSVGRVGAVQPGVLTQLDGRSSTDNPRFQNFPHESTNTAFVVETGDDLCTNCHPADQLP